MFLNNLNSGFNLLSFIKRVCKYNIYIITSNCNALTHINLPSPINTVYISHAEIKQDQQPHNKPTNEAVKHAAAKRRLILSK